MSMSWDVLAACRCPPPGDLFREAGIQGTRWPDMAGSVKEGYMLQAFESVAVGSPRSDKEELCAGVRQQ